MKTLMAVVLLWLGLCSNAFADTGFIDRSLSVGSQQYKYQVYVPVDWSSSRRWPVVVNLHGNGGQGSDGLSHTKQNSLVNEIRGSRDRFPAVVIWPQARAGTRWSTPAMQEMVLAQIDATIKEFSGDAERVYLTGFSMGGGGVIRIASRWPVRFAALVDMAGRVSVNSPGREKSLVDEDVQAHLYLQSSDPFVAAARSIRTVPIWVAHGDADTVVPVEESRRLVASLKSAGANVHYTEYAGGDHNSATSRAWADQNLVDWLFAQRRSGGPSKQ